MTAKILVIDDSDLIRNMLNEALVAEGYRVTLAADANQGYAAAVQSPPDLILLDIQLPDVVGFDLIRVIRNRDELRRTGVILITGSAHETADKVKGFRLGADDYVAKPFVMAELLERIRAVLRRVAMAPAAPAATGPVAAPSEASSAEQAALPSPPATPNPPAAVTPRPLGTPSRPISSPVPKVKTPVIEMPLKQTLTDALIAPERLEGEFPHAMTSVTLGGALSLLVIGLLASAGARPNLLLALFGGVTVWGLLLATLVMASSISGITLAWRSASHLLAVASTPWLVKMAGAALFSIFLTLSPLTFTAGPAMLFSDPPDWLYRVDLFEFWSAALLVFLLHRRHGATWKKAGTVAGICWGLLVLLTVIAGHLGGNPS